MNGGQDLGGVMGFGPVIDEPNEPHFHEGWEARVLGLTLAMGTLGLWNIDKGRYARENRPSSEYLNWSYYRIWLAGLETLINQRGLLDEAENAASKNVHALSAVNVAATLAKGGPANRKSQNPAKYKVGDNVTTKNIHPTHHTRLPRYLRGHIGKVVIVHGAHVFPDFSAHDKGDNPQWLYTVRFKATDLWGADKNPNDHVHADLWEPYFV
ncbi:nitrile hydratase subunit beta [Rhodobacterales bacterium 52_120_T64]|nr:nitrile hydratase subunit beta [Rhodobacterales bacterium 52_120_T64]